ncbi:ABC transporter permease [Entomospira culicis]|uniref:ABC transporter permease n=1 Tax=Entomospira culicis TaxID=2719989 RepID=A0A968GFC4_9SPIO|nr:ABC transporter permease [Entomospira culicis]NIZ19037.1 ABC transporter permease [Entomospira culicis]NIZ69252.1 ABC transporter permease [Entomospira culicis]WDI37835.1 ABC transporter permease [Entomospira culicis]WDI39463.1 ABC transporter permease [Entomospira culicis]
MDKTRSTLLMRFVDISLKNKLLMSLYVVAIGFLLSTLLLLMVGKSPMVMYNAIFQNITGYDLTRHRFNARYIGNWLMLSMPLVLTGLSLNFAFRSGFFNIGAEGQFIMGLTFAQYFAFVLPPMMGLTAILAVLLGGVAGAMWGGIVGFFRGKYQVSEVVLTIMFNYIAFFFSRWFSQNFLPDANSYRAANFPQEALLTNSWLQSITNNSQLNNGIFIALIALLVYHLVMEKTVHGFSLRASGFNPMAAKFSGIAPVRSAFIAMAGAGAFAGLAGGIVYLGSFTFGRVIQGQDGYGFTGIAVGLVSGGSAIGTLLSGLFFGLLNAASPLMQSRGIPREITSMISAFVVILIALEFGIKKRMQSWLIGEQVKRAQSTSEHKDKEGA